jgi:pimeloyl-ACP methyl ester carboxylesterase
LRALEINPIRRQCFRQHLGASRVTPGEVSFDSAMPDYNWTREVARAGFDVFSVSLTGYGRSTRPAPMADPCNIAKTQQAGYVPSPCEASYRSPLTTMGSDWNDIGQVVDHVRRLRGVETVSLVGWSQGGPRITGYAALQPARVERIVVLAPAYNRDGLAVQPNPLPAMNDGSMSVQSRKDFIANWDRQVGCTGQYEAAAATTLFDEMLASDPVGAAWGAGVRRAPIVPTWGFSCSSHNAMWEKHRKLVFDATVQWLRTGQLDGMRSGTVRMGY